MNEKLKILFVEDDPNLSLLVKNFLTDNDFNVVHFLDGENAYFSFKQQNSSDSGKFDICILDCMLPGMDGFTLAEEIKQLNKSVPIIFLTARNMKEDKIKGFKIGVDDYITKPFDEDELLFRIQAILRRSGSDKNSSDSQAIFNIGKYTFDFANQSVSLNNEAKRITKKESDILKMLCLNKNKITRRDEILISIWGENDYFHGRSLDVFITKIRKYLKDDSSIHIENIHNVGFILNVK